MLLQMSKPGLLGHVCVCVRVFRGVVHGIGEGVSRVAAATFSPSPNVIKCINV